MWKFTRGYINIQHHSSPLWTILNHHSPLFYHKIPFNHHQTSLNHHFPMVFLWFSYGFPIKTPISPWNPLGFLSSAHIRDDAHQEDDGFQALAETRGEGQDEEGVFLAEAHLAKGWWMRYEWYIYICYFIYIYIYVYIYYNIIIMFIIIIIVIVLILHIYIIILYICIVSQLVILLTIWWMI